MKAWITKYALTTGIREVEAEIVGSSMVKWREDGYTHYTHGRDWHTSHSDAIDRAEDMRDAKVKAMRKRLSALEEMTFAPSNVNRKEPLAGALEQDMKKK